MMNPELESLSSAFRLSVMDAVGKQSPQVLISFQGVYLFCLNKEPAFYLEIHPEASRSGTVALKPEIANALCRVTVNTDAITLEKLLKGNLKAKMAFLTGKVKISGDVAAFLKLVSFLKAQGVKQKMNAHADFI